MKIAIFRFDGITALDAVGPYESLARVAENEIVFVAKNAGSVRTDDGFFALTADIGIDNLHTADVLIVPGGHSRGLRVAIADRELQAWIKEVDTKTRWTCLVFTGLFIFGAAGLLSGRKVSTHWRAKTILGNFGATYSLGRITVDGKYVSSTGVSAGIDMGLALCGEIADRESAEAIELSLQYDPHPPFGTGDPERSVTPARVNLIQHVLRQSMYPSSSTLPSRELVGRRATTSWLHTSTTNKCFLHVTKNRRAAYGVASA